MDETKPAGQYIRKDKAGSMRAVILQFSRDLRNNLLCILRKYRLAVVAKVSLETAATLRVLCALSRPY